MTVYVDNARIPFGNKLTMCHCFADTRDELFIMMATIGMNLKHFQRPDGPGSLPGSNAQWEHFDIGEAMRARAIAHGAVEVDSRFMVMHADRQKFIRAVESEQWRRAATALKFYCLTAKEPTP